ncbi:MAG: hypothetical protein R3F55_19130 [Alphaproteobacteria bacterium]
MTAPVLAKAPPALVQVLTAPIWLVALAAMLGAAALVVFDLSAAVGTAVEDRPGLPLPETLVTAPGSGAPSILDPFVSPPAPGDNVRPYSPSVRPLAPERGQPQLPFGGEPLPVSQAAMQFSLHQAGGVTYILAAGRIAPGSAQDLLGFDIDHDRKATLVVFDSPGGSVTEAMQMGAVIRARGLDTMVVDDGLCASSCPLAFAGGVRRIAFAGSWIGVHRAFITEGGGDTQSGLRQGQQVAAACMRHLEQLGVDPRAWIPALSTSWDDIYFFTADQLTTFAFATEIR